MDWHNAAIFRAISALIYNDPTFYRVLGALAFNNPTCCRAFIFRKATFSCIYRALTSKTPAFFLTLSAFANMPRFAVFLMHSYSKMPRFPVLLVHYFSKTPFPVCFLHSSQTCHIFKYFQCMLLPKCTKIPHHRAFHLSRQPPIHMYRPRSGKCTRTLQIQKLILGTRPKMTDTENISRNPPTKLQIQKLMAKKPHQELQIQKLIRKTRISVCVFFS